MGSFICVFYENELRRNLGEICQPCSDLPDVEVEEGRKRNRPKHDGDVFVIVKEYICSLEMRQKPFLCLPAESKANFPLTTNGCLAVCFFWWCWI